MASDPFEGFSVRDIQKGYEGLRQDIERSTREINRAARDTGAASRAARTFEDRLGRVQSDLDAQGRRAAERLGTTASGAGGAAGGGRLTPEATPALRREYERGLAQQTTLMATATEQTKRLGIAQRELHKVQQQISGTRASAVGATGLQRESIEAEVSRLERLRESAQGRVSDRTGLLAATQQRLAAEQALLATLEAQAATLTRMVLLSQQAARGTVMANRMLGAGTAAGLPVPAAPRLPSGGGLPPIMLPPQQFRWGQQPPRALGPGPQPIAMLPTRASGGTVWRMPPVPPMLAPPPSPPPLGGGGVRAPGGAADFTRFPSRIGATGDALRATNDEMRRYGALSTEFIDATRRGAVSISELGWQLTSTASKFGGWLAAGGAIYGLLGAIGNLREGAIESQSGVEQLGRVVDNLDPSDASARFRELSHTFNLSISDVADASFEMGKAFSDQEGALTATEAVLSAVVVGEMDMATASRYLTSIIHGFNLEAGDMNLLMDQANEAQNKFGVNIPQTVAGVAKAAGLMNAAGGDLETTLALVTTISRVTGQTGEVAGTAIARSPNFLRRPSNQAALRDFGVDPLAAYPELIDQAFEVARDMNGRQIQELAAAIFGPLYGARSGTALLQNEDFYRRVQGAVAPSQARGSAEKERESVLAEARQEIAQVGVTLEQIGSVLMDIGAFDAFAIGLVTLNDVLTVIRQILEVFNSLPAALRQSVVYFGQMAAAIAVMRRFNVGPMIAAGGDGQGGGFRGALATLTTRRNNESFLFQEALLQEDKAFADEARRNAQRGFRTSIEKDFTQGLFDKDEALMAQVDSGAVVMDETERKALDKRMTALHMRLKALNDQELTGIGRTVSLQEARIRNQAVQDVIAERGGLSAAEVARMETALGLSRAKLDPESVSDMVAGDPQLRAQLERAREQARGVLAPQTMEQQVQVALGLPVTEIDDEVRRAERAERTMRQRIQGSRIGTRLGAMGQGVAQSLRAFGQGLMEFVNPMTAAIAAIAIIGIGLSNMQRRNAELEAALEGMPTDLASLREADDQLSDVGEQGYGFLDIVFSGQDQKIKTAMEIRQLRIGERADQIFRLREANDSAIMTAAEAEEEARRQVERIAQETSGGLIREAVGFLPREVGGRIPVIGGVLRGLGENIAGVLGDDDQEDLQKQLVEQYRTSLLFEEDFRTRIEALSKAERDAVGSVKDRREAIETVVAEINASQLDQPLKEELMTDARLTVLDSRNLISRFDELADLVGEPLAERIQAFSGAVSTGLTRAGMQQRLLEQALVQAASLIRSNKPEDISMAADALNVMATSIREGAQVELNRSLTMARSQGERNKAYSDYFDSVQGGDERVFRQAINQARRQIQAIGDESAVLREDDVAVVFENLPEGAKLNQVVRALENQAKVLIDRRKMLADNSKEQRQLTRRIRGLMRVQKEYGEIVQAADREQREAMLQENQAMREARSSYRQSQLPLGAPRLREALRSVRQRIQAALRFYGRDSQEVLRLLTEEQEALNSLVQEEMAMLEANQRYEEAGFTGRENPIPGMQTQLANQRERIGFMRRHPTVYSPSEIRSAEAEARRTELEIAEAIRQRAEEAEEAAERLIAARSDTRVARLEGRGDRVGVAREQRRQARREYRQADTPLEREEARARLVRSRTNVRDQLFQRELEDIQFGADIGKLTLQQQISQYQQLLKNATLNRDQRRDLRRRIYQLEQEAEQEAGSFDLQVGNIRLPSVYEIRRAIQAGGTDSGPRVVINQHNSYVANGVNTNELMGQWSARQERANRRATNASRSAKVR